MIETSNITGERINEYLSQKKRFDSRKLEDFREIIIEKGILKNADGSARVKLGKTEVLVGIKMGVDAPYPDSQDKGNLITSTELSPLSSARFEENGRIDEAIELERIVDRGIRESKFIDMKKLCIKEGEKVWTVFIDIYPINDDGNLIDAAGIGAVVALKNAKMPKYDKEEEKVLYGELTKENLPLSDEIPLLITIHRIGDNLVVDPTREEEIVSETRVSVCSFNGIIFAVQKGNSGELNLEEMDKILKVIEKTERELFGKIQKFI